MESRSRLAVVRWADLPPELLAVIAGDLQNPIDITRFRSVCRSWRCSISPPLSPLLPCRVGHFCLDTEANGCHFNSEKKYVIPGAVYLLSPRDNPSKAWIVSVQESKAGKLHLRHALTHEKIRGSSGKSIDLSEWSVTLIAMSYSFRLSRGYIKAVQDGAFCEYCDSVIRYAKVIFACIHLSIAMVVFNLNPSETLLCPLIINEPFASPEKEIGEIVIDELVNFSGRIYAVDWGNDDVFVLDPATAQLIKMNCINQEVNDAENRIVVSEGELYLVFKMCEQDFCWGIYKSVMDESDVKCCSFERVENLGDRVFFIARDWAFSMST